MAAIAVCLGLQSMQAQSVAVSPVPQQVVPGKAVISRPAAIKIDAPTNLDPVVKSALTAVLPEGAKGMSVTLGVRGDKTVSKVESKIPNKQDAYYLNITPKGIVIAGNDVAGLFYGVQTLKQLLNAPELTQVEIVDWPDIEWRGVIEGFYGNPWSYQDRLRQFDFYGANKMNIYVYGPKDDPYHHDRWYEPYPSDKAAEMRNLVKRAADNKVKFVWAMHPSNSIVTAEDRIKATAKFQQMYDLGVRAYAIFFDDISAKSVDDQISYLNFLTDNFVNTHDGVEPLVVCPTQYNKAWSGGEYLSKMGDGLYPGIRIMWTGNTVCDMIDRPDCEFFIGQTGRKPFIWLNYPVNDYGLHHLLMGPFTDNGNDIDDVVSAFCSNPMQYAEASMVALYGLADFSWNIKAYDAQTNWERCMEVLAPGHVEAFKTFCINNVDVGPSGHRLRFLNESPEFVAITKAYPELNVEAAALYAAQFDKMKAAADELLANTDQPELMAEIKEFVQYFGYQAERGNCVIDMYKALNSKNNNAFIAAYRKYNELTAKAEALMSRGFEGSIQSVAPRTGALYVEPFIKTTLFNLVEQFKASGAEYPADLFPTGMLDNGFYRIKFNGMYLSNPVDSKFPVLNAEEDNINPGRQQWYISLDPVTERYRITNEWDKRYINELGAFGVNAFDSEWNTYDIFKKDGKYAIQNAGNGGIRFWASDGNRLMPSESYTLTDDMYIFEIEPVSEMK